MAQNPNVQILEYCAHISGQLRAIEDAISRLTRQIEALSVQRGGKQKPELSGPQPPSAALASNPKP